MRWILNELEVASGDGKGFDVEQRKPISGLVRIRGEKYPLINFFYRHVYKCTKHVVVVARYLFEA